jgi:hypothetical protein
MAAKSFDRNRAGTTVLILWNVVFAFLLKFELSQFDADARAYAASQSGLTTLQYSLPTEIGDLCVRFSTSNQPEAWTPDGYTPDAWEQACELYGEAAWNIRLESCAIIIITYLGYAGLAFLLGRIAFSVLEAVVWPFFAGWRRSRGSTEAG